jgi:hypothetical protein
MVDKPRPGLPPSRVRSFTTLGLVREILVSLLGTKTPDEHDYPSSVVPLDAPPGSETSGSPHYLSPDRGS